jgi:hypothetical protein
LRRFFRDAGFRPLLEMLCWRRLFCDCVPSMRRDKKPVWRVYFAYFTYLS